MPTLGLGLTIAKPRPQSGSGIDNAIQKEDSEFLLLESGYYILLE